MSVKQSLKNLEVIQAERKKSDKRILDEIFESLFEECPEIHAVGWHQYTPYFNDGEPCEFSLSDIHFTNDKKILIEDYADVDKFSFDELDCWYYAGNEKWEYQRKHSEAQQDKAVDPSWELPDKIAEKYEILDSFERILYKLEDILESQYGNGAQIIVTRDETIVEEYDCGH